MKVVISNYGEFCLSGIALRLLRKYSISVEGKYDTTPSFRSHPVFVGLIEEFGQEMAGQDSVLRIIDIPTDAGMNWCIRKYMNSESVWENNRNRNWI